MPCALCAEWIPSESVTYSFHHVGDEIALYTLGGDHRCTVSTLDRNEISNVLGVRDYRITVHENEMVIQVCGEWMRWRLCESSHHQCAFRQNQWCTFLVTSMLTPSFRNIGPRAKLCHGPPTSCILEQFTQQHTFSFARVAVTLDDTMTHIAT